LIPAVDPKEAMEALYTDAFTHMLQRIDAEDIDNDLIKKGDIPKNFKITVTLAPDLEQDDLRNAQIGTQLLNSGANVSKKWVNTNVLKIADSEAMWKEKKMEELRDVLVDMLKTPEVLGQFVQAVIGKPKEQKADPTGAQGGAVPGAEGGGQMPPMQGSGQMPPEIMAGSMPGMPGGMQGMEQMPKTDPMIPPEERR